MPRVILFPYKMGSESCKALSQALREKYHGKILRVRAGGHFHPRSSDTILTWGNSPSPEWRGEANLDRWLNKFGVKTASNKLETFRVLTEVDVDAVPWTTDRDVAREWATVVERHTLTGHSGAGIEINAGSEIGTAPLYTKLLAPSHEYRVHVFGGKVIDYTKKLKRVDGEIVHRVEDDHIRNAANGWEYIRDVEPRESVKELAVDAIAALGLDFGAVDIIRHKRKNYVLEVNTACGLSPRGIEAYSDAIIEAI